jgi:hypothetical protein
LASRPYVPSRNRRCWPFSAVRRCPLELAALQLATQSLSIIGNGMTSLWADVARVYSLSGTYGREPRRRPRRGARMPCCRRPPRRVGAVAIAFPFSDDDLIFHVAAGLVTGSSPLFSPRFPPPTLPISNALFPAHRSRAAGHSTMIGATAAASQTFALAGVTCSGLGPTCAIAIVGCAGHVNCSTSSPGRWAQ